MFEIESDYVKTTSKKDSDNEYNIDKYFNDYFGTYSETIVKQIVKSNSKIAPTTETIKALKKLMKKENHPLDDIGGLPIADVMETIKTLFKEKDKEISELRTEIKKLEKSLQAIIEQVSEEPKDKIYI